MSAFWPRVRLGDVLTHYRQFISQPESREYRKLSVKLYGKGVVLDAPVNGSLLKMKRHQLARAGQVILSEIWGKKGAIGLVPVEGDGALCTSHFFLFDVNLNRLDRGWLQAIFRANFLEKQLEPKAKGTTGYAAVRPALLLECKIPLPELREQKRIALQFEQLCSQVNDARELRLKVAEEVSALARAATNILLNGPSSHQWPTKLLGDVAEIRSGVTLGRELRGRVVRLPYLRVANVQDQSLDLTEIKEVEVLEAEVNKWALKRGDILLTEGGDWDKLGRGTVWRDEIPRCIHQNHIFRVRLDRSKFVPEFVSKVLSSPAGKQYFQGASKQTTNLASINQRQLKAFRLCQPPLSEQRRIVSELDAVKVKIEEVDRAQLEISSQLDAMLPAVLDRTFRDRT